MTKRLFLLAAVALMISIIIVSIVDFVSHGSRVGQAFARSGKTPNSQDKDASKLKPNQRCSSTRNSDCQRSGAGNNAPEAELKVSAQKITLHCKEGETDQNCTPSADQKVQLVTHATDTDGDTLSYTFSTTGGTIEGKGSKVTWDLTDAQPGTYTATVEVDDTCGCIAFSSVKVEVTRCPECR
ncbi:MAG: Ig-like domain-containing protein [Acidobacteriota bacterium]|nr:Ig-like domain-containing protein [Acidobacteriota bacterium]